jgi:hypothetical protein
MDFAPSLEQEVILKDIEAGSNIVGDCVAGSGKTTTVLFTAKRFPKKRILQITYNAQLKLEVREKVLNHSVNNLEIHTYHSLCVKYYDANGRDDAVMRRVVEQNMKPKIKIPVFNTLILDEAQDMKDLFYNLVVKFCRDMGNPDMNMLVLGDRYQAVYKFMGADSRFLTLTHNLWKGKSFENRLLSTSYRLTNEIATFVNDVMIGYKRIQATRAGSPVVYIRDNVFEVYRKLASYIIAQIRTNSIKPEDIFILAGSISGELSPLRKLENELVNYNIPCYYPTSDERKLDEDIIEGKVIFSSFHQAKGRERKLVIVYGFDSGYFKFFGKDYDPLVCPETLYVACTRAKEKLILIEDVGLGPLPFLKMNHDEIQSLPYVDFSGRSLGNYCVGIYKKSEDNDNIHIDSPTSLVKFLNERNMKSLIPLTEMLFTVQQKATYSADIPSKISCGNGLYEEVSDINGIVIPAMYEAREAESTVQRVVKDNYLMMSQKKEHEYLQEGFQKYMNQKCISIAENLYLSVLYICMNEKLYHKIKQIKDYDWLSQVDAEKCWTTLDLYLLNKEVLYEQEIDTLCDKYPAYGLIQINGRFDVSTDDTIWELKCVDILTIEHLLQVVVYAWLWRCEYFEKLGSRKFQILNMRTGEVLALKTESHLIDEVMSVLFENRYGKVPELSDSEFIERCQKGIIGIAAGSTILLKKSSTSCCLIEDD